jgi:hypothetical protein
MQPTPEVLAANQRVANEAQHQSNPKSTPNPDFDFKNAFMGQQDTNMTSIELQHQKQNQQHHVHHQQEYQQQQEWQQQQQQQQQPQQNFPNPMYQLPMEMFSQEQLQQQQQPMLPNQIEKLNPLQQQPMEVPAQAQKHQQQKLQQHPNIAHHQLRFQEDSQPILLDNHSQFQQQAQSVNQHELIQQLQEGPFSGL